MLARVGNTSESTKVKPSLEVANYVSLRSNSLSYCGRKKLVLSENDMS